MRSARRHVRTVVTLIVVAAFTGCATSGTSGPGSAGEIDVTGGLELEMLRTSDDRTFARYRVLRDGRLEFGGGADAVAENYTWSGELTDDEIARLKSLIARNGWAEADPPSIGRPPGLSYTIRLRTSDRRRSFTVLGAEPGVTAVHDLLAAAARRRHRELLDTLPRPGERR